MSDEGVYIHQLAYIDPLHQGETHIGPLTNVWAYAHIGIGAKIGARCTIGSGVHVGPKVVIGNGCKIQNGAQLFEGVTLEDDVFIGPHVVFTNVFTPRAHVPRRNEFKPTLVRKGASIGANATILCGITIGEYALVGAGTVVIHDVPPHRVMVGNPARGVGWACCCGETLGAAVGHSVVACVRCNAKYKFGPDGIRLDTEE